MLKPAWHILLYTTTTLLLLVVQMVKSATNNTDASNDALLCKLALHDMEADYFSKTPSAELLGCMPVDDETGSVSPFTYILEGLPHALQRECRNRLVADQDVYLSIPGGQVNAHSVIVPDPSSIEIVTHHHHQSSLQTRTLQDSQKSIGILKVLVLRIIALDSQPAFSADQLYSLIFTDDISLRGQMSRCSAGKLTVEPTEYGVLDVPIDMTINGLRDVDITNAALAAAPSLVGDIVQDVQDLADAVMFVVPPGSQGSWQGFGGVNGKQTTFNDMWAGYVGAQMHEIGHNLGLFHANENGVEYADSTGYMGRAAQVMHYPSKCYNAQNHWHLGWFADRSVELDVTQNAQQLLSIASFVDYPKTYEGQYVVVKIGDYYLQYNRKTSFNEDTGDKGDMLTIVKFEDGVGTSLVAGLDQGTPYWNSGDYQMVVVQVCQTVPGTEGNPDVMIVSVGVGDSACSKLATNPPATSAETISQNTNAELPPTTSAETTSQTTNAELPPTPSTETTSQTTNAELPPTPSAETTSPNTNAELPPTTSTETTSPNTNAELPPTTSAETTSQNTDAELPVSSSETSTSVLFPQFDNPLQSWTAGVRSKEPSPQVPPASTEEPTSIPAAAPAGTATTNEIPLVDVPQETGNSDTQISPTVPPQVQNDEPSFKATREPSSQSSLPTNPVGEIQDTDNTTSLAPQIQEEPSDTAASTSEPTNQENSVFGNIFSYADLVAASAGGPPTRRLWSVESNGTRRPRSKLELAVIGIAAILMSISACVYAVQMTEMSFFSIRGAWQAIDKRVGATNQTRPLLCQYSSDVERDMGDYNLEAANSNHCTF